MNSEKKVKEILGFYGINSNIEELIQDKDFQLEILMIALESANKLVKTQGIFINRILKTSTPCYMDSEYLDEHIKEVNENGFNNCLKMFKKG